MIKRWIAIGILYPLTFQAAGPVSGESLQYNINWPSGLGLGEGRLKANKTGGNWNFEMEFEASLPGFAIADKFFSTTNSDQCSVRFDKELQHGRRKTKEKISFDSVSKTAERETNGGGKSKIEIPACAKDALAFLFFLRTELAQGRIPPAQNVYYGAPYRVRLEYKGTQRIRLGEGFQDADRLIANVKGPLSDFAVEVFFAKDESRTPLAVKLPLNVGTFSMEIVR